jgi:Flp pilus assembly protein TadD
VAYRRAAEIAPDDVRAVSGLALTADTLGFEEEARVAYARWAELERELDAKGPSGE